MTRSTVFRQLLSIVALASALGLAEKASAEQSAREARVRRAEEHLAREPSYSDTVEAAIRFHSVDPDQLRDTLQRVRSKSALPYLRVSERFEQTRSDHALNDTGPNFTQINSTEEFLGSRDAAVAMLAWDLPQAVFNTAELQTYQQSGMQMGIMRIISWLYHNRQQMYLYLLVDPPVDQRALTAARLRIQGFTSLLNTFTGGWFGEHLPEGSL